MRRSRLIAFGALATALLGLCCAAETAPASVIFVDIDRPPGGDGVAWESAFSDLQDALERATGDPSIEAIWVAEGIYRPDRGTGDRDASFRLFNGLAVYGGFAGSERALEERDPSRHVTVLSGDLAGDDQPGLVNIGENSLHVVDARNANIGSVLDGFTVSGGNADHFCCGGDRGGGMLASFGSPTLRQCTFRDNRSTYGGAIYFERQSPHLADCLFAGNTAEDGGAIYCRIGTPLLEGCTFEGNTALRGGGLCADDGAPQLVNCTFMSNVAETGGGIFNFDGAATISTGCVFMMNEAITLEGIHSRGGAAASIDSAPFFDGCTFTDNFAFATSGSGRGAALFYESCTATVTDCFFEFNVAEDGGAQYYGDETVATVTGCLFSGNLALFGGGALVIGVESQCEVLDCIFERNHAIESGGGAIRSAGGSFSPAGCIVSGCLFEGNGAESGGAIAQIFGTMSISSTTIRDNAAARGGGLELDGFEATMTDCLVEENRATVEGGGLWVGEVDVTFIGTRIERNTCDGGAGGGIFTDDSDLTLLRCTVAGNSASQGGGLYEDRTRPDLLSSIVVGNTAVQGAGLYLTSNGTRIDGCTIAANAATAVGGAIFVEEGSASVVDSILWGNVSLTGTETQQFAVDDGAVMLWFSNVEGLESAGVSGNIASDPMFVRAPDDGGDGWGIGDNDDYGDLHLSAGSPCLDRGDPARLPPAGTDIDGEPRVQDCRIDMGADEASLEPADCNGNGIADACELLDGTSPDCNNNAVPDECDIAMAQSSDCNFNAVPDDCEILPPQVELASEPLFPIGFGWPQSYELPIVAPAAGPVTLVFAAFAQLASVHQHIDVDINGTFVGRIFESGAESCAVPPSEAQLVLDAATFNEASASGSIVITMTTSSNVQPTWCSGTSSIVVEVSYAAAAPNDLDDDGVLDSCTCPADCAHPQDGIVGVDDLVAVISAWGASGGPSDVNADGVVGIEDLVAVIVSWGPCR